MKRLSMNRSAGVPPALDIRSLWRDTAQFDSGSAKRPGGPRSGSRAAITAVVGAWIFSLVCLCLGSHATAQEQPAKNPPAPAPAAVAGIKGVKEEGAARIKNIETGNVAVPKNTAQGVSKIDGINTVNGVKADGRTVVLPPPPTPKAVTPPPPPPPATRPPPPPIVGTAVNVAVGTVGTGAVRPVTGVTGINAVKLQNLEAALAIKQGGGPEKGAKGKAAAAELLGAPGPGPKAAPKTDGRSGFQEFEKLPNKGS